MHQIEVLLAGKWRREPGNVPRGTVRGRLHEHHPQEKRQTGGLAAQASAAGLSHQERKTPRLPHPGGLASCKDATCLDPCHFTCCCMGSEHKLFQSPRVSCLEAAHYNFMRLEFQGMKNRSDKPPAPGPSLELLSARSRVFVSRGCLHPVPQTSGFKQQTRLLSGRRRLRGHEGVSGPALPAGAGGGCAVRGL